MSEVKATDTVHQQLTNWLRSAFPKAEFGEVNRFTDLVDIAFADRYLSPTWVTVISGESPVWRLERATVSGGLVDIRATWAYRIDNQDRHPSAEASAFVADMAREVTPAGNVQRIVVLREQDEELPFETVHRCLVVFRCECDPSRHVVRDEKGVDWLIGTNCKVDDLVTDYGTYGLSVREMFDQHYQSISLPQIHGALTYYDNHRSEVNQHLRQSRVESVETVNR